MSIRIAACLLLTLLVAGDATARKVCGSLAIDSFPGVDANGNIDTENTGAGTVKICISTGNGKLKQTGQANVPNESNSNQRYKNPPELAGVFDPPVVTKKISYKVKANGSAKLVATGDVPDAFIADFIEIIEAL